MELAAEDERLSLGQGIDPTRAGWPCTVQPDDLEAPLDVLAAGLAGVDLAGVGDRAGQDGHELLRRLDRRPPVVLLLLLPTLPVPEPVPGVTVPPPLPEPPGKLMLPAPSWSMPSGLLNGGTGLDGWKYWTVSVTLPRPLKWPVLGSLVAGFSVRLVIVAGSVVSSMPAPVTVPVEALPWPLSNCWMGAIGVLSRTVLASRTTLTVELALAAPVPTKNAPPWPTSGPTIVMGSLYSPVHFSGVSSGVVAMVERASISAGGLGRAQAGDQVVTGAGGVGAEAPAVMSLK